MKNHYCEITYKTILNACPNLPQKEKKRRDKRTRFVSMNGKKISISNREFQCIKLLAHGKRIKEIGRYLEISNRTVECYLGLLKEKTSCFSHEHLVDFYWTYLEPKNISI